MKENSPIPNWFDDQSVHEVDWLDNRFVKNMI